MNLATRELVGMFHTTEHASYVHEDSFYSRGRLKTNYSYISTYMGRVIVVIEGWIDELLDRN